MGLIKITLKLLDKKETEINDLFSCSKYFINFVASGILYGLIILGGFILLIVPGIIWSIKYKFFGYFIIDKGMGPVEALKASANITQGAKWDLFLFGILLALINLLGALALLVGLFVTIPTTLIATTYVYRKLAKQAKA